MEMLEEWKYTSKSAKGGIQQGKFNRWTHLQIPCYLKALNLFLCRLRVYFTRGDYSDNVPQWWEFILEYSKQEIDETWNLVSNAACEMIREGLV